MADTGTVDDLVLAVVGVGFGEHVLGGQLGGHRFVEIDDATPDFGMLQRQRAAQAPQHRMGGVGPIAFGDRGCALRVSDEQLRRRRSSPTSVATSLRAALNRR